MKKKILILGGGYSKERLISIRSAKAIIKSINNIYKIKFCDPCHNLLKTIKNFKPDVIFNALHGRFGEDGFIQSIFETLGIKYTHSGVISSMSAMDKEISKKIFIRNKILTPKYIKLKNNNNINYKKIKNYLNYPVVIKPINEGSSL
ncbi:D-alanine--D-alanine ligase, partial [Candidatus Pelagibacter sp.]|nr:D-alanine--D-alanine ligase [Candidatus Pelagibacter sp.]